MQLIDRREFLATGAAAVTAVAANDVLRAAESSGDELAALDGIAQAELVSRGEVTPRELVDAAIARIEKVNPKINAVVTTLFDEARKKADGPLPEGPFRGVPFLIKDLCAYEGAKLTYGCRFFRDNVADHTPEVARRMERAGLVVVGKSNTPEFGLLPMTEPLLFGPTNNPWDPALSPGGSSGGAAAAVASAMVPLAHGSDGGGSIRIPASACGVFGVKISRGRNPQGTILNDQGLSVNHCVSRSVRDSAALLDATNGALAADRWQMRRPERPYREEIGVEPRKLRIAFMTEDFSGRAAHAECVKAVESTAKLCEELGHEVEAARPEVNGERFADAFIVLWGALTGNIINGVTAAIGRRPPQDGFEPWTWQLNEFNARHTAADVMAAWQIMQPISHQMARFLGRYDLLLTPVLGEPPMKTGELSQLTDFDQLLERVQRYVAFTPVANATGQPAMSVPLYWTDAGAPVGSHFIARHGDEATLFRLAAQLEQARPWTKRSPQISAASA